MRHLRVLSTIVAIAACSAVITSQTPSGHAVFEQALAKERVEGNLLEAIRLYERVVAEFASDRALAARSLLQMGLCHEKLGQTGGARAAYERLRRDYSEQVQVAGDAKTRLAALASDATAPARQGGMTVRELPNVSVGLYSVSPDGTQAIGMDFPKGLSIVDLATGQSRLLTNVDGTSSRAEATRWLRDGRHIAYVQHREVRVAAPDGKARTIYRWDATADDALITTGLLPDGSAFMAANKRPDGRWAIGLVATADGRFTPLRTLGWDFTPRDHPKVSPDGRFVAYVERTAGQGDLHLLTIDGREPFRITDHPADDRQPMWSPDGRHLAFISNRFGTDALWTVAMEDGRAKSDPVKLKDGMNGVRLLGWSRRGLIYEQKVDSWDVFTIPMGPGSARSTGAPRPVPYVRSGWNVAPAWSPDGKSLAFVSGSLVNPHSRYLVVRSSSGGAHEIPIPPTTYPNAVSPSDIRWFGDGRGLGFSGEDSKGQDVMFRLSLSTGQWTTIPLQGSSWWTGIEWNDDGSAFYFVRHGNAERNGIVRKDVESGREELLYELTTPEAAAVDLEISPDRRWLAFRLLRDKAKGFSVIALNLMSGERRTVASQTAEPSRDGETLRLSGWSPDGRVLVEHRPSGARTPKWLIVPLDGSAAQPLSVDMPPSAFDATWSPDGASIAFVQSAGSSRLLILENPLADLPAIRIGATRR